ncbi:MAG: hypothetical protein ACYCVY_11225 [Acidiferrobacteraceae bacterium]
MSSVDMTIGDLPPDAREAVIAIAPDATEATVIGTISEALRAQAAALVYAARRGELTGGKTYPIGTEIYPDSWRRGSHRPWLPSHREHQDCCDGLRRPSWRYHWNLFDHCRTLPHICNLLAVCDVAAIRAVIRTGLPQVGTHWIKLARA